MTDTQGRDAVTETELALDEKRQIPRPAHAPHVRPGRLCHAGRRSTSTPTISPAACRACTASPRSILASACVFTNTAPIGPYRGAGRPEANYALDRAVEEAARVIGDRHACACAGKTSFHPRRCPARPRSAPPTTAAIFPALSRKAHGDEPTSRISASASARRPGARSCAASASPACSSMPARCRPRAPRWRFPATSKLILGCNVQSTGQGHATVFGAPARRTISASTARDRAPAWRLRHWTWSAPPRSARARRCAPATPSSIPPM